MRILFIRRQHFGGIATYSNNLAAALNARGIEVVIDDAEGWIPKKTGWLNDRNVSKLVRKAAQGFDLVHAFGYRSAWACSEAFYVKFPWVYTAYDMPKTTHTHLIDRLNAGKRGLCSSRALQDKLTESEALHLHLTTPCIPTPDEMPDQVEERARLELPQEAFIILAAGNGDKASGIATLLESFPDVVQLQPSAFLVLVLTGDATEEIKQLIALNTGHIKVIKTQPSLLHWMACANLVVVPNRNASFSMIGAESMSVGTPVLFRRDGGLGEMASDGYSGWYFDEDEELTNRLSRIIDAPLALEAMKSACRVRAMDRFGADEAAEEIASIYRRILS